MIRVVVVYHSGFGHTKAIAESVVQGVGAVDGVDVEILNVDDIPKLEDDGNNQAEWQSLNNANAIVFGSPTYMGSVSAAFKGFMDQTGGLWFKRRWIDKVAAGFTVGGGLSGDKQSTLQAMHTMACQHGMIWVSMGIGVGEEGVDRLSSSIGMMAQSENAPADQTPPREDHLTAERFGERVAIATKRWSNT
ncbi:MAG: flavodoxin family protein [Phycisphaerales bacterium]|nr:flavodoxin family protein [Phycisphaerales bacterium]